LISSFRDPNLIREVASEIAQLSKKVGEIKIVHFCGTHEYSIAKHGLRHLLPEGVRMVAGPGCPVCVTPAGYIDTAIELATSGIELLIFGDLYRVPGSEGSLAEAKAGGAKVSVVYSLTDAIDVASRNPEREFIFFAVGFETTACTIAAEVCGGRIPKNMSLLIAHRLIPPLMELLVGMGDIMFQGYICPGHVSTIIGCKPYEIFPRVYRIPSVIAGFEPLDVMLAIRSILGQHIEGVAELVNEYKRAVKPEGNIKAQEMMARAFDVEDGYVRGIGRVPESAYELKEEFGGFDARKKHGLTIKPGLDVKPGCYCHHVVVGRILPPECPMFMRECTPDTPYGPCMVSSEGTCLVYCKYGRWK
jgi:hydrogenase expression/formation protein HypD